MLSPSKKIMNKISIIIPVFNEERLVANVIEEIKSVVKGQKYEIIAVNDGSTDNSLNILKKIKGIKVIEHPYKKGYGASIKTGVRAAKGNWILTIDADGQHNAVEIPRLLKEIGKYDLIVGARSKKDMSFLRNIPKVFITLLANYIVNAKIADLNSGLRVARKSVIERFMHLLPNGYSLSTTLTLACFKSSYNVKYVPIKTQKRKSGKSKIRPIEDTVRFIVLVLRMCMLFNPLKIFLPITFLLSILSLYFLSLDLFSYYSISDVTILTVILTMLIFFFGLIADQIAFLRREII